MVSVACLYRKRHERVVRHHLRTGRVRERTETQLVRRIGGVRDKSRRKISLLE